MSISNTARCVILLIILVTGVAIFTLIKLVLSQQTERFSLSGMIGDLQAGKDPTQMQTDLATDSQRISALSRTEVSVGVQNDLERNTANQEKQMRAAEGIYYGLAKHVRSGNLMQVYRSDGVKLGDGNSGFWVEAAADDNNIYGALQYEDKFRADGGFSREYALWKCSQTDNCKGAVVARDGSRFGLFSQFIAPSISVNNSVQNAIAGGEVYRGSEVAATQTAPDPTNTDYLAQDYDLWVKDSPERATVQAAQDALRGAWSGKQGNQKLTAENTSKTECQAANPSISANDYTCTVTECVDRGKNVDQGWGNSRWESEWDCYAKPLSNL